MSANDEFNFTSSTSLRRSSSPPTNYSNIDLNDVDDDDDEIDEESPDCLTEVHQILRTFGSNECAQSSLDYYDSRRYEIMYEIMNMERQFDELKNTLYEDSILLIDRKLVSIQNEEAPEYQDELQKLHNETKLHLEIAKQRRQIELQALQNSYESELLSLEQTFENDKFLLSHQMHEEIEQKIDELETLKLQTQLCANILQEMFPADQPSSSLSSRKRFDPSDSNRTPGKKRRLNSTTKTIDKDHLAIFYQLSAVNVLEDCAIIQSSLPNISDESDSEQSSDDDNDDDEEDEEESNTNRLIILPSMDYCKEEKIDCDTN